MKIFNWSFIFVALTALIMAVATVERNGLTVAEGWYSDIAYNWDWQNATGKMAQDIPYGKNWASGIGRGFFWIHRIAYELIGVGFFQARLVTLVGRVLLVLAFYWGIRRLYGSVAAAAGSLLLVASPLLNDMTFQGRQEIFHCLFALLSFLAIRLAQISDRPLHYFWPGFLAAASVDIDFRGIEIVLATYAFHAWRGPILCRRSVILLSGSFAYFLIWVAQNVAPMGLENYIANVITPATSDGGEFSLSILLSEWNRFQGYFHYPMVRREAYLVLVLAAVAVWKTKETGPLWQWLLVNLVAKTLLEKTEYLEHLLVYYPVFFAAAGIGFREIWKRYRRFARIAFPATALVLWFWVVAGAAPHIRHRHVDLAYNPQAYFLFLRKHVDTKYGIIGVPNNWYAFPDANYYGAHFYLGRIEPRIQAPGLEKEERRRIFFRMLKERNIRYLIWEDYFDTYLSRFLFDGPPANFELRGEYTGDHTGCTYTPRTGCVTRIYWIKSYE